MEDFQTWILCDKTVAKSTEYNFVETERTPTITIATTNTMSQTSVTPTMGMLFFTILDNLQQFHQGQ